MIDPLLDWYRENRRDLPWRKSRDPWRTLVAEVMLHQTRVAAVVPRYETFLARFPDPESMAGADEEEVLAFWSGLGYYRRARHLHAAAREIRDLHGGRVPGDRKALRALPGIGDYTVGAILSIAFDEPEPIVDGNVERVLSRVHLVTGRVDRGPARRRIRELAGYAVRAGPPAEVNQALMELGALVCLPGKPRCGECPLEALCRARREGRETDLPERAAPPEIVPLDLAVAVVREGDRVLLAKAPPGGLLAGLWGPPFAVVPEGTRAETVLAEEVRERLGLTICVEGPIGVFRHAITHHRIRAACFAAALREAPDLGQARLATPDEQRRLGISSLARKALDR